MIGPILHYAIGYDRKHRQCVEINSPIPQKKMMTNAGTLWGISKLCNFILEFSLSEKWNTDTMIWSSDIPFIHIQICSSSFPFSLFKFSTTVNEIRTSKCFNTMKSGIKLLLQPAIKKITTVTVCIALVNDQSISYTMVYKSHQDNIGLYMCFVCVKMCRIKKYIKTSSPHSSVLSLPHGAELCRWSDKVIQTLAGLSFSVWDDLGVGATSLWGKVGKSGTFQFRKGTRVIEV